MLKSRVYEWYSSHTDSLVNSKCKSYVSSCAEFKRNTIYIFKPSNFSIPAVLGSSEVYAIILFDWRVCLLVPRTDTIMYTHTLFYFNIIFIHTFTFLFFSFFLLFVFFFFFFVFFFISLYLCFLFIYCKNYNHWPYCFRI